MPIETIYEEYAVLDAQIKLLINQKDELRDKILEGLVNSDLKTLETNVGKFTVATVKTWNYTDVVTELEEKFKAQKASEQSTGDATFEEKPSLRFTQVTF
jgi:hypothetical protein